MAMNGGKRVVLSTILGVVLAAAMIISLSTFATIEQPQQTMRATENPPKAGPSFAGPSNESIAAGQAQEANQDKLAVISPESISVKIDPVTVGTPFALALLAGVGVFLVVRSRVK